MISALEKGGGTSQTKHTVAQMNSAVKRVETGRKAEEVGREFGVSKHVIYAWKAIDFGTGGNAAEWNDLQKFAYTTNACVEPYILDQSSYDHIHMDWRAGYPGDCPTMGGTWGPH